MTSDYSTSLELSASSEASTTSATAQLRFIDLISIFTESLTFVFGTKTTSPLMRAMPSPCRAVSSIFTSYFSPTFTGESLDDPLLSLPKLLLFDLYTFHLLFLLYNHMCGAHIVLCYVAMIRARLLEFKQRTRRFCIFNFWVDIREEPCEN